MNLKTVTHEIRKLANDAIAKQSHRFFKTGPGEYGEGDKFLGIRVPELRKVARRFKQLDREVVKDLLHSVYHEERLVALLILVQQYEGSSETVKEEIFNTYLSETHYINNWDLVDLSAHKIVGRHLRYKNRDVLRSLAVSGNFWERRIAIIATFDFIRCNDFNDTLAIADILLTDNEDLIHKAVGWMLREVGKRNQSVEEDFLRSRYRKMPRTMLRYSIERFDEQVRQRYLKGKV
jgi:3-methyladenine DNA glycosylase AlkD